MAQTNRLEIHSKIHHSGINHITKIPEQQRYTLSQSKRPENGLTSKQIQETSWNGHSNI